MVTEILSDALHQNTLSGHSIPMFPVIVCWLDTLHKRLLEEKVTPRHEHNTQYMAYQAIHPSKVKLKWMSSREIVNDILAWNSSEEKQVNISAEIRPN